MDALTLLNQHVDVIKLLEHYDFDNVKYEGNMIRCSCKLHGGNNPTAFVISPETGLFYCHTGDCGGGDVYTLVQKLDEVPFKEAVQRVANLFGVDIENLEIIERKESYVRELNSFIKVMKSRKKKPIKEYSVDVPMKDVARFRSFKEETLQHFGLKFVEEIRLDKRTGETYLLRNRLALPIMQDGVQVGMSFRRTRAKDFPKWSHQPLSIETKSILYNYDEAIGKESIVIVEGALDVWAYYEIGVVAVATFGAHITDEQYKLLMRTGADLIFSYDGDEAGRNATTKAINLFKNKANLYVVPFEEEEDPESIERSELVERYERRKRY